MKNLLLGLMMLFAFGVYAQNPTHTIDFEPAGVGADWDWTVSDNDDNPALEFVANPLVGGINTSATAAKFTARVTGQPWALCFTDDDGQFTFDATNSTITMMVYKPVVSNVGFKVEGGTGTPTEIVVANTLINTWEELTFDFSAIEGQTFGRLVIIPDFDFTPRAQENIVYFDNIQVPDGVVVGPLPEPTTVPPTPPHAAVDVLSIYSEAYTNLAGTDFNPPWGQSTAVTVDYVAAGNNTLKYENLNYQGTQFTNQDLSLFEYLHVDFWTPNATDLNFFLISPGAETSVSLTIEYETWVSVDIDLTDFVPPVNLADVFQFKVTGNQVVYFDNWYFWKNPSPADATLSDLQVDGTTVAGFLPTTLNYDVELPYGTTIVPTVTAMPNDPLASHVVNPAASLPGTTTVVVTAQDLTTMLTYNVNFSIAGPEPTTVPPTPPHAPEDVISIYSDAYLNVPGTNYNPFWGQATVVTVDYLAAGNNTLKYANLNYQGTEYTNQDVSGYENLHVDFWTNNSTDLGIYLISPGAETEHVFTITTDTWVSVDIPLTDFVPPVNLADVFQFKVEGNGDIFFDNFYFWKTPGAATNWTGANGTAWDNDLNWEGLSAPTATDNAVIPTGLTNYPSIDGYEAVCADLEVEAGASFTIQATGGLNATGTVLFDGDLMMYSDASGNSSSFRDGGIDPLSTGFFTYVRTIEPYDDANDHLGWHYIASPIEGFDNWDMYNYWVNTWNEPASGVDPDFPWVHMEGSGDCIPAPQTAIGIMEGWSVRQDYDYACGGTNPGTGDEIIFGGSFTDLHTGDYNRNYTAGGGHAAVGYNLMGNPYASFINMDAFAGMNVHIWNGSDDTYLNWADGGDFTEISPTQGFFVYEEVATVPQAGNVALTNANRVFGTQPFEKSTSNQVVIRATGNDKEDKTYIRFSENATAGYDNSGMDAYKLLGTGTAPQIYTVTNGIDFSINTLAETPIIPMSFFAAQSAAYTIEAIETGEFATVVLEDRFYGVQTDLLTNSYTFNYTVNDDAERFFIHFTPLGAPEISASSINLWSNDHKIYVQAPDITGDIVVFNMMGQEVTRTQIESGLNVIPVVGANAYYVVKIIGSEVSKTGKVYVK